MTYEENDVKEAYKITYHIAKENWELLYTRSHYAQVRGSAVKLTISKYKAKKMKINCFSHKIFYIPLILIYAVVELKYKVGQNEEEDNW